MARPSTAPKLPDDPVLRALANAPVETDWVETEEERQRVKEAWEAHKRGESITTEELLKELGVQSEADE